MTITYVGDDFNPNFDIQPNEEVDSQATTITYTDNHFCNSQASTLSLDSLANAGDVMEYYEDSNDWDDGRISDEMIAHQDLRRVEFEPQVDTSPDVFDIHDNLLQPLFNSK